MERNRTTEAGISVESRIQQGLTHFFGMDKQDDAYDKAREIKSYVYPCFESIETEKYSSTLKRFVKHHHTEQVGFCVPV